MNYVNKDELLAKIGLARRATVGQVVASAMGPFGIGMLLGAGVALLFAPKSGQMLREDIRTRVRQTELANKFTNGHSQQRQS